MPHELAHAGGAAKDRGEANDTQALPTRTALQAIPERRAPRLTSKPWWPWVKRSFAAVLRRGARLLVRYARTRRLGRGEGQSMQDTAARRRCWPLSASRRSATWSTACFDLVGRHYTGHTPGTALGDAGQLHQLRLQPQPRLAGGRRRLPLPALFASSAWRNGVITRIVSMSMLTNWLGYILLAGLVFIIAPLELPPAWHMDNDGLQLVGVGAAGDLAARTSAPACAWATAAGTSAATRSYLPPLAHGAGADGHLLRSTGC